MNTLRFLFIGDIIGQPGVTIFQRWASRLKEQHKIDAIIVNGENSAKNGKGIMPKLVDIFKNQGVSVITTGNHVFDHKEIFAMMSERDDLIRPANLPPGCPGKGYTFFQVQGQTVAIINLHGRVFTRETLDCPFRTVESLLTFIKTKTNLVFVDFHAEATSEKSAMGLFLDGKVSGVLGTHTHVQTADERVLPQGTAFITDLGCCGALNSIIGFDKDLALPRFITHLQMGKFVVEIKGPVALCGAWVEVDAQTGKALKIERVSVVDETICNSLELIDDSSKG
jgi:2',3'-cyclic-nucleotide 2'-phosphodiesterase